MSEDIDVEIRLQREDDLVTTDTTSASSQRTKSGLHAGDTKTVDMQAVYSKREQLTVKENVMRSFLDGFRIS